jgi:adenylate kinase
MRLVFLGPPGSGKGTQAKTVAKSKRLTHISTGDVLRKEIKSGSELGVKAKSFMDAGALVPDDIVLNMIKDILQKSAGGFIFDGFPRTAAQAEALDRLLDELKLELDAVINLVVDDDEVVNRILGRFNCPNCGADFNIRMRPPKADKICDNCGGELIRRSDDTQEVIANRLKVYREKTKPVEDYYRSRGLLVDIDGKQNPDGVTASIIGAVG